ncbi:MAG: phosphoribosyltransferase family protein [Actinomycetota bacterium]
MFFERLCAVCAGAAGPVCDDCGQRLRPARHSRSDVPRAAFVLDAASRPVITALKYRGERWLAGWAGAAIVDLVPRLADAICWVPATPERVRWRGYDQGREIAREVGRTTGVPSARLLSRDPRDHRQTSRTRAERRHGPTLRAQGDVPSFVVLVDDVVTTGATLRTAADALRAGGADRVVAVAVAATPLPHDRRWAHDG